MTNDMAEHRVYIEKQLDGADDDARAKLFLYHTVRMHDFQHERLIHLIVTVLVALITVMMVITSVMMHELMFLLVDLILLPLLLAYLIHYRTLENGVQDLYVLTKRLGMK
jgi:hypothetical protein